MSVDDLARRITDLERMHQQDGICLEERKAVWHSLNALKERVKAIEIKFWFLASIISLAGPLFAQWIGKRWLGM